MPILIKSNKQESIFVKWKSFIWYISINKINDDFWFSKKETDDIHEEQRCLHIINSDEYNFEDWEWVFDKVEMKILNNEFLSETIISGNEWEFVIPMRYLESVDIPHEQISKIIKHEDKIIFIKELFKAPKFECSLNFFTDLNYLDQCLSLFPQKWTYSFIEWMILK